MTENESKVLLGTVTGLWLLVGWFVRRTLAQIDKRDADTNAQIDKKEKENTDKVDRIWKSIEKIEKLGSAKNETIVELLTDSENQDKRIEASRLNIKANTDKLSSHQETLGRHDERLKNLGSL